MKRICTFVALILALALPSPQMTFAATPQAAGTPKSGTDRMAKAPPLLKLVYAGKGAINVAVRKAVRDSTDIFLVNWPYVAGAHSTTLYSLGKSNLNPEELMFYVKQRPSAIIVNGGADLSPPSVAVGTTYKMGGDLKLVVFDVSPCTFTLVDQSHRNPGSVTYGAFKDSAGERWLFEECTGDFFISPSKFIGLHHRPMAESTHKMMDALVTAYIGSVDSPSGSPGTAKNQEACPAQFRSNYTVGVNGPTTTGIQIKRGDKIEMHASGEVSFGFFAGSGGPEGIQFNPSYSYYPDSPHGCLIARVRHSTDEGTDPWSYVGKGTVMTAQTDGSFELNVNDKDPGNNTGQFSVEITVCKGH
jgi:hypothetical protein